MNACARCPNSPEGREADCPARPNNRSLHERPEITIEGAINACLAHKQATGCRPQYIKSLRQYWQQFAHDRQNAPIGEVNTRTVTDWFASRQEAATTQNSNVGRLKSLFAFARREGWIEGEPCAAIEKRRWDKQEPRILQLEEAEAALRFTASKMPDFLPSLTLAMFCGLRPDELTHLEWNAIDFQNGRLTLTAEATKTRRRRIVPVEATAQAWLRKGGQLPCPPTTRKRRLRRLRELLGFQHWPQDVFRHTAASYQLAATSNAAKVAFGLGHSETVLMRHYHAVATPEQAETFFGLTPERICPDLQT